MKLNEKGQCPVCRIKPLEYKRAQGPGHPRQKFCHRCSRSFDFDTGEQQGNWAWRVGSDGIFEPSALLKTAQASEAVEK